MVINPVRIGFALIVLTFAIGMGAITFALYDTPISDKISDALFSIFNVVASISLVYALIGLFVAIFTC